MSSDKKNIFIESIDKDKKYVGFNQFDCGDATLNRSAKDLKRQVGFKNLKGFVLFEQTNKGDVVMGFATARLYQLSRGDFSEGMFTYALPPNVSVIQIPMIAINKQYQRQGWGEQLLRFVLDYVLDAAEVVPDIKGVYLDAKPDAVGFYTELDFDILSNRDSNNGAMPMFISIDTLQKAADE